MYVTLIGGFVILLVGGELLVKGAVSFARGLSLSPLVIGLTIVAFGTSLPELVVSVQAVLVDRPSIALGNVVGSNIANVLLVLGLSALIFPLAINQPGVRRNTVTMVVAAGLLIVLARDGLVSRPEGLVLIALLVAYLAYSVWRVRHGVAPRADPAGASDTPMPVWQSVSLIAVGLGVLPFGANLVVSGASAVAQAWRVPEEVIAITIVAVGTSLPEMATTIVAAFRRHADIAVGNVIGSNIFNIFGIMGLTALVRAVSVAPHFTLDFWVMLASAVMVLPFALRRSRIGRLVGLAFLALYVLYVGVLFAAPLMQSQTGIN